MSALRHPFAIALFAYLAFVVYGSLVPFEVRALSLEQAMERFLAIPYLQLGAASRADWVANIVLYVPLAYLGCAALGNSASRLSARMPAALAVFVACIGVAVTVEFTQLFFAPRTVSQNDLIAETIGSALGAALWLARGRQLQRLGHDFALGDRRSLVAAIAFYLIFYLALGLFPFDFVVSASEFEARTAAHKFGLFLATTSESPVRLLIRLAAEAVAIAPLGILVGLLAKVDLRRTLVAGLLLGITLEILQIALVSGITQGVSALMRGIGLAAGAWLGRHIAAHGMLGIARLARRASWPALPVYIGLLAVGAGWGHLPVHGIDAAIAQLGRVSLVPFYYHYYTSEPVAMASLLANFALYAPLGLIAWARQATTPRLRRRGLWGAVALTVPTVVLVETSRLWLAGAHPDPTNLLIGTAGAVFTYGLSGWLARVADHADSAWSALQTASETKPPPVPGPTLTSAKGVAIGLGFGLIATVGFWQHPGHQLLLLVLAGAYGFWVWRSPWVWLAVLPATLPVLDLSPLTGRLLLDAFDLGVLVTLGIAYARVLHLPARPWPGTAARLAVVLTLLSTLLATLLGLTPWDGRMALDSSHPSLEALAVGKGALLALAFVPLLRRIPDSELDRAGRLFVRGLALGVTLLGLAVLWERHTHVGIGDFSGVFRVTGTFSAMYNGGAYIEAFIALAFPALMVWTLERGDTLTRLAGMLAIGIVAYAMLVTFSRGGYAGLGVAILVTTYLVVRRGNRRRRLLVAGLVGVAIMAGTPVLLGSFAQERLARAGQDLQTRLDHWAQALGMIEPGYRWLTGMGFGSYPKAHLWSAAVSKPSATYGLAGEDGQHFVRMTTGDRVYLDQWLSLAPGEKATLSGRLRFGGGAQAVKIHACRKALLYSFACKEHLVEAPGTGAQDWQDVRLELDTRGLANPRPFAFGSTKLSLGSPDAGYVDILELGVTDANGMERLRNGQFENGMAGWMPVADFDLAWHIHQTPLEVLFTQGMLGLAGLALLVFASIAHVRRLATRSHLAAIPISSGLLATITVGVTGSTLDTGRLLLAFLLTCFVGIILIPTKRRAKSQN